MRLHPVVRHHLAPRPLSNVSLDSKTMSSACFFNLLSSSAAPLSPLHWQVAGQYVQAGNEQGCRAQAATILRSTGWAGYPTLHHLGSVGAQPVGRHLPRLTLISCWLSVHLAYNTTSALNPLSFTTFLQIKIMARVN